MQFDVVIPTRGNTENIKNILLCISLQSLQPQQIIFVVNGFTGTILELQGDVSKNLSPDLYKRVLWHIVPNTSIYTGNASYARNKGRSIASSDYVYFLDDDNQFSPDFFARSVAEYLSQKQEKKNDIVYSPTIMWRQSDIIQSLGIKTYHFLLGWPEPVLSTGWKYKIVSKLRFLFPLSHLYKTRGDYVYPVAVGGNSLFSTKKIFETYAFDESMSFVYEDIDCIYRMTKSHIPLVMSTKTYIHHMEVDKNKLQQSFLATPISAYQKAKNRIVFVKKNGSLIQKILFYIVGLPITSLFTVVFIIVYGGNNRLSILRSYISGIIQGIKQ